MRGVPSAIMALSPTINHQPRIETTPSTSATAPGTDSMALSTAVFKLGVPEVGMKSIIIWLSSPVTLLGPRLKELAFDRSTFLVESRV